MTAAGDNYTSCPQHVEGYAVVRCGQHYLVGRGPDDRHVRWTDVLEHARVFTRGAAQMAASQIGAGAEVLPIGNDSELLGWVYDGRRFATESDARAYMAEDAKVAWARLEKA